MRITFQYKTAQDSGFYTIDGQKHSLCGKDKDKTLQAVKTGAYDFKGDIGSAIRAAINLGIREQQSPGCWISAHPRVGTDGQATHYLMCVYDTTETVIRDVTSALKGA